MKYAGSLEYEAEKTVLLFTLTCRAFKPGRENILPVEDSTWISIYSRVAGLGNTLKNIQKMEILQNILSFFQDVRLN